MDFFYRFRNPLVLALLLLLQTVGLAIQVRQTALGQGEVAGTRAARGWVVTAVSPLEQMLHGAGEGVRGVWENYLDLRGARRESAALRGEVAQLRLEQASLSEDALEGQRLEGLLNFQEHYPGRTVAAEVMGTGGSELSRVVYLNKGAADGLRADMAVLTADGIVGKVREVYPGRALHTAQVLLLNDQTSGAGVILGGTRVRAVLRGTTRGELQIGSLTADDRLKVGDRVVTSGGDGIFPRGLPVGEIAGIGPDAGNAPYLAVRVRPSAPLDRLEEVLVLTGTVSELPAGTMEALGREAVAAKGAQAEAARAQEEREAAAEAARQEAARSAAEIVADRLPSLREGNGTAGDDAAAAAEQAAADSKDPKNAGGTVPRPLAPAHADRYTPGTAPQARDLEPGARGAAGEGGAPQGQAGGR